jgi:hypothetical protein
MAPSTVPRLYHSTAILLPDAAVVTAGGNPEGGTHVHWDVIPRRNCAWKCSARRICSEARPTITTAPAQCTYEQAIQIQSPQPPSIRWASPIRNCVTTHSFDGSQRLVDLDISSRAGGVVTAKVQQNRNLAPAGWYIIVSRG